MRRIAICVALMLVCARCGTTEQKVETASPTDSTGPATAKPGAAIDEGVTANLPATKTDTIRIEGSAEPVQLQLFRTPATFALPFYTYHPSDMVGQLIDTGLGSTARFTANFGGTLTDDAIVEIYVYPEGLTTQEASVEMQSVAQDYSRVSRVEHRYPWSIEELTFRGQELVGRYMLGEHDGRFFRIHIAYPPEFGDGFPPRVAVILNEWHWSDDRALLG